MAVDCSSDFDARRARSWREIWKLVRQALHNSAVSTRTFKMRSW